MMIPTIIQRQGHDESKSIWQCFLATYVSIGGCCTLVRAEVSGVLLTRLQYMALQMTIVRRYVMPGHMCLRLASTQASNQRMPMNTSCTALT